MRFAIGLAAAALTYAQGTTPKATVAEYPVHGEAGPVAIGAEYMVHSFGSGEQMYVVENFLVLEVALYPPKGETFTIDQTQFMLHVNGKKAAIIPQPTSMVAATLSHPEWRSRPTADIGAGPVNVGLGYPPNTPRFPGAPPPPHYPAPPRAPDAGAPGGIEKRQAATPEELLTQTALPSDPRRGPVSGFLFFPYTGKTSSIKSLELKWREETLKLR